MMREGFWRSRGLDPGSRNDVTDLPARISDLARFPELVWLNEWWWVPPALWAVASYLIGGMFGLLWATMSPPCSCGTARSDQLHHALDGKPRYVSGDFSKNSFWLALVDGRGWLNHHYYQRSTNQGFFWCGRSIRRITSPAPQALGVIWDIHVAPGA